MLHKFIFVFLLLIPISSFSQGFLKTEGKLIVNEAGESVILRGMGLGGWMVQEGYMMQTADFANAQHKIKEKIVEIIGEEATEEFYDAWLTNYMQKADVDSLKSWGFNSVRLPMHYNLYTLPIEEEPIPGQQTWLEKGFILTDSLISWCAQNEMYVILDLHAAPGGQGYDEGISDYDPDKPSFWESSANRTKAASLWKRLAERYVDEPWVGGYDLINEPNWNLPGGSLLRSAYEQMTDSIRLVDNNHIIFIEGNWFANDFTGLTPPWDDNLVYSPHKYWSINDQASIQWVLDLRNQYNVPLYLGESGENSNVWFRDAIKLLEDNDIGWAWWPLKKIDAIAGPLSANKTFGYEALLNYWKGTGSMPTQESATFALMQVANNYKLENCRYERGVIDAMFRQVSSDETLPYNAHSIPGKINAVEYDLGRNGFAYQDSDEATYHVSTGSFTAWNNGWSYRNDGVDIEPTMDSQNDNGYNVGWTAENEWLKYSLSYVESGVYEITARLAGGDFGGVVHFSANDAAISSDKIVPSTGGYQNWNDVVFSDIAIYDDFDAIKFHIDHPGFNISSYEFTKTGEIQNLDAKWLSGITRDKNTIELHMNKALDANSEINAGDFSVLISSSLFPVANASFDPTNNRIILLEVNEEMFFTDEIKASYFGTSITSLDGKVLETFFQEDIKNTLDPFFAIPGKIEAESFFNESGITLETTTDNGGGFNIGYLDVGDFCEYDVYVSTSGQYDIQYRNASDGHSGGLSLELEDEFGEITDIHSVEFSSTGGWQTWQTTTFSTIIPEGRYTLRLRITKPQYNLNWMNFQLVSNTSTAHVNDIKVFPNPTSGQLILDYTSLQTSIKTINCYDVYGNEFIIEQNKVGTTYSLDFSELPAGLYYLKSIDNKGQTYFKSVVKD